MISGEWCCVSLRSNNPIREWVLICGVGTTFLRSVERLLRRRMELSPFLEYKSFPVVFVPKSEIFY